VLNPLDRIGAAALAAAWPLSVIAIYATGMSLLESVLCVVAFAFCVAPIFTLGD
jgi:hypothetical protein